MMCPHPAAPYRSSLSYQEVMQKRALEREHIREWEQRKIRARKLREKKKEMKRSVSYLVQHPDYLLSANIGFDLQSLRRGDPDYPTDAGIAERLYYNDIQHLRRQDELRDQEEADRMLDATQRKRDQFWMRKYAERMEREALKSKSPESKSQRPGFGTARPPSSASASRRPQTASSRISASSTQPHDPADGEGETSSAQTADPAHE
jgi:hypothetical protein